MTSDVGQMKEPAAWPVPIAELPCRATARFVLSTMKDSERKQTDTAMPRTVVSPTVPRRGTAEALDQAFIAFGAATNQCINANMRRR